MRPLMTHPVDDDRLLLVGSSGKGRLGQPGAPARTRLVDASLERGSHADKPTHREAPVNNRKDRRMNVQAVIAYQDDAVVSKTLIKSDAGTVTLFAFDQSQELSEHTAPYDALVHVIDGAVEISIEGVPITVRNGEMLLMPAHRPHALRAVERFKMVLTMIKASS